jgi:hypothetical protein
VLTLYNVFFTSLPPLFFAFFEKVCVCVVFAILCFVFCFALLEGERMRNGFGMSLVLFLLLFLLFFVTSIYYFL